MGTADHAGRNRWSAAPKPMGLGEKRKSGTRRSKERADRKIGLRL